MTKKRTTNKANTKQTIRSRDEWEWHATGDGGGHWVRRDPYRDEVVRNIARDLLFIATLETRNSDQLDFHEVAVWQVRKALEAAFAAGRSTSR